jgi:hypothetical protein
MRSPIFKPVWLARLAVGVVFFFNVTCALAFIARPGLYAPGFECEGVAGQVIVRGFGILFLMWNATYPPVLLRPARERTLFGVIVAQQAIGLLGEMWMWLTLPPGHDALWRTGLRFILFDGVGLLALGGTFALLTRRRQKEKPGQDSPPR